MTDVQVPFHVRFPPGWTTVDPAATGSDDVVLAATRDGSADGFATNILIAMRHVSGEVDLLALADAAAGRLAADVESLAVADRATLGTGEYPGVGQVLDLRADGRDLVQSQVQLVVPLTRTDDGVHDQLVVELTCTCPREQAGEVRAEFAAVVDSLEIREP